VNGDAAWPVPRWPYVQGSLIFSDNGDNIISFGRSRTVHRQRECVRARAGDDGIMFIYTHIDPVVYMRGGGEGGNFSAGVEMLPALIDPRSHRGLGVGRATALPHLIR
jgi:hypothetical protein